LTSSHGSEAAQWAAAAVRQHVGSEPPVAALILGSGLGRVADDLDDARSVRFSDIPGFSAAAVAGHAGRLVSGLLAGKRVLVLAGRIHAYEGHPLAAVAFPVRVLHALGAGTLFVSNAAGGIRRDLKPGDLMVIEDHLNLMFASSLTGPPQDGDERFPDMSLAYDELLRQLLLDSQQELGLTSTSGVYAALSGPSYETRAEVRMLERLGADAVGMSTVPEVVVARARGMRVAGVSCISNLASGISDKPQQHSEVIETTERISVSFRALVRAFISKLP
jgi:purine-nucleoside phosphorylase